MSEKTGSSDTPKSQQDAQPEGGQNLDQSGGTKTQESGVDLSGFYSKAYNDGMNALLKRAQCESEDELLARITRARELAEAQEQQKEQQPAIEELQKKLQDVSKEKERLQSELQNVSERMKAWEINDAVEGIFSKARKPRLARLDYFDQFQVVQDESGKLIVQNKTGTPIFDDKGQPVTLEAHAAEWLKEHLEHQPAASTQGSGSPGAAGEAQKIPTREEFAEMTAEQRREVLPKILEAQRLG